jgi:O-antigen/teichoic acid export membrane protein
MSRSNKAAKGFATSLLQSLSQILVQILLAPVVLRMAGKESLGAYAAIMQAVGLLSLVDIAGSWSLERFLGKATGVGDDGRTFRAIFTTARTTLLITNAVFGLGVLGISLGISRLFHLSPSISLQARHALYVIAAWAVLRTPLAAYQNALNATQDMAATNVIATGIMIARSLASLSFVLMGGGLFGLMISGTVVDAIGSWLYRRRFRRRNPDRIPSWGIPDKALFREMLGFGGHVMLINIGNKLFFNSANMMAALTNGAVAASSFYTSQMPTMTGYTMMMRLPDNAAPAVYELSGREESQRLRQAFLRLTRIMLLCTLPLACGVMLFNHDLVTCWVGPNQYGGSLLSITLACFCVLDSIRGITVLFAFAQGWVKILTSTALFQGAANFGLAYLLGRRFGLGGITLALSLVLLPQMILLLRKVAQTFSVPVMSHLLGCILRLLVPLGAAGLAGWSIHLRVRIAHHHFPGLLMECNAFIVIYALLAYPMGLDAREQQDVKGYLLSALRLGRSVGERVTGMTKAA